MSDIIQTKAADEVFCRTCGSIIKQEAEICPNCGARQIQNKQTLDAGIYITFGVVISVIFSVFTGWIYFLIISSIYPDEELYKEGITITGKLTVFFIVIAVIIFVVAKFLKYL